MPDACSLALVVLLTAIASCAIPIKVTDLSKKIPRTTVPIAVAAGVDALDDPEIKRRIQRLMATPEMRRIEQELVAGMVDGTLAALSEEERAERFAALMKKAMTDILRGAVRELEPRMAEMTRGTINGALDAALDPGRQRALDSLVEGLVKSSIRSAAAGLHEAEIGKNLASAITEQLGPALKQILREDLAPSLAELLNNEEFQRALGETARMLARETVLGVTEALAHTQKPKDDGSILARVTELIHQGARLFGSAAWVLLLVIVTLVIWTIKLLVQSRRYREESDRRAATARLLVEATQAAEGKSWSSELIGVLMERIRVEEEAIAKLRRVKRGQPLEPLPR
jgi:hypothetical protein